MTKSFGDTSLEVQMGMMLCSLLIALVYFLFIIYEIIWRQKKKQIVINVAVFTVTFFAAACFPVRHLISSQERELFWLFRIPLWGFAFLGACEIAFVAVQIRDAVRGRKQHLQRNAIQESLDNLPSGVGFFDEQGMPVLLNRQMHKIGRYLTGSDIQSAAELRKALEHPVERNVFYDPDFQVYCFWDGSVWKFSEDLIVAEGGERFWQFLASEVSELYQNKQLLEKENRKLQEMAAAMKELSKNIVTLTREEEILAMKMRVHDDLGYSVLAAHRMLLQDSEEARAVFLSQWKRVLHLLREENETAAGGVHQMVQERAEALGVNICYTGEIPEDPEVAELMDMILLEALSNSVRHAGATKLYADRSSEDTQWQLVITNNGRKPEKEIEEGGGLSAIRKKVENFKGTVSIRSIPFYSLTVKIPKKEEQV